MQKKIGNKLMVKCHLSRLMGEKKIRIADLARKTKLHRNTLSLLYNETAVRVDIETIEKLCMFFNCQVGELFEYVENNKPNK
jgi:putative transcriptional regulator